MGCGCARKGEGVAQLDLSHSVTYHTALPDTALGEGVTGKGVTQLYLSHSFTCFKQGQTSLDESKSVVLPKAGYGYATIQCAQSAEIAGPGCNALPDSWLGLAFMQAVVCRRMYDAAQAAGIEKGSLALQHHRVSWPSA
eukprot:scaffold111679_cov21-Tisochrysis_lutea.AAC.3